MGFIIYPGPLLFCNYFLKNTKDESKLKRKCDQDSDEMSSKNQRVDNFEEVSDESITSDLIVLGLSFKATTSDIREYFGTFGPLELAELKTEDTGQIRRSKGFAFIKFKDLEAQEKVLLTRHSILDRWCDVKLSEKPQKRKFQHESDEMFSKNQRVDDFDGEVLKGISPLSFQRFQKLLSLNFFI